MSLVRTILAGSLVMVALMLVAIWVLLPPDPMPARFDIDGCRRVAVTGSVGGETVRGIEDIALHPDGSTLILSAHDRSDPDANGALYSTSIDTLTASLSVVAEHISPTLGGFDKFRPHGIGISPDGGRLAVVNRFRENDARVELGTLTPVSWEPDRHITHDALCRANDVMFTGQTETDVLVTIDRSDCVVSIPDLLPRPTGSVFRDSGFEAGIIQRFLMFPNGIAGGYIAHTRADKIVGPDSKEFEVPGAPDNLSIDANGNVIAAVHPKPFLLWLYLKGIQFRAPSRVVMLNPDANATAVLYDDPEGLVFSGATSAVLRGGVLVAGSVRDEGLLVCSNQ